jgi:hypothetical protein
VVSQAAVDSAFIEVDTGSGCWSRAVVLSTKEVLLGHFQCDSALGFAAKDFDTWDYYGWRSTGTLVDPDGTLVRSAVRPTGRSGNRHLEVTAANGGARNPPPGPDLPVFEHVRGTDASAVWSDFRAASGAQPPILAAGQSLRSSKKGRAYSIRLGPWGSCRPEWRLVHEG